MPRMTERWATLDFRAKRFSRIKAATIDVQTVDWAEMITRSTRAISVIVRVIQSLSTISRQVRVAFLPSIPEPYPNQRKVRNPKTARTPIPPPKRLRHPLSPRHSFKGSGGSLGGAELDEPLSILPSISAVSGDISYFGRSLSLPAA
jgi:hypothetical protein